MYLINGAANFFLYPIYVHIRQLYFVLLCSKTFQIKNRRHKKMEFENAYAWHSEWPN